MAWNGCSGKEQGILEDKEAAADKSLLWSMRQKAKVLWNK
jgi:hypothetical protein